MRPSRQYGWAVFVGGYMKTTAEQSVYVIAGPGDTSDIRMEVDCASDGAPETISGLQAEGMLDWNAVPVELVERIAAALAELRRSRHDTRKVCPDHGYFDGQQCKKCEVRE